MRDEDTPVVEAIQAGDTEAFRTLVDRHQGRVASVLLRLVADPLVAEELAHETFVRAFRALPGFRGDARFGTWLIQIAIHQARDHQRRRGRSSTVSLDELKERGGDAFDLVETRPGADPLETLSEQETAARYEAALATLPREYREVIVLHHGEDLSYERIAEMTGDSVGALKVRAHRARKLLKEAMFPDGEHLRPRAGVPA